jgi:predicted metal-dependent hydrolase
MEKTSNYRLVIKRNTRRRNVSLYIIDAGTVEVRAPAWVAESYINQLIQKKQLWIAAQLAKQAPVQSFVEGSFIWLNGIERRIEWFAKGATKLKDGSIGVAAENGLQAEKKIIKFLRDTAMASLEDRVDYWVAQTGLVPHSIAIRSFSARWGSCDSRRNIKLNWRLIQAPTAVQDYVIIHELAHLEEMNHSVYFWRCVEQYDQQYKTHRRWLRENANRLMAIG